MTRPALLAAAVLLITSRDARADKATSLPPLPVAGAPATPIPPPPAPPSLPPPPAPPSSAPAPDAPSSAPVVDATNAPPGATVTYSPPPAPYQPSMPTEPAPPPGVYEHDGFYLRVDTGIGAVHLNGTAPGGGSASFGGVGSVGRILIGGTPGHGLVFGGGLSSASTSGGFDAHPAGQPHDGWDGAVGALEAFVDWFPSPRGGWHVGGDVGLGGVTMGNSAAGISWAGGALAAGLFGGYDFWIGPQWSLGIEGIAGLSSRAKMMDSKGNDVGYALGAFDFGIAASLLYH